MPLVKVRNKCLGDDYFISSFLSGLREEIKNVARMFGPKDLKHTIGLAILQESVIDSMAKKSNPTLNQFLQDKTLVTLPLPIVGLKTQTLPKIPYPILIP